MTPLDSLEKPEWSSLLFPWDWVPKGFLRSSVSKTSACNAGDQGSIPGSGRCPGDGNGNPLQCSPLENPIDGGAWQTVWGTDSLWGCKSQTWLSTHSSSWGTKSLRRKTGRQLDMSKVSTGTKELARKIKRGRNAVPWGQKSKQNWGSWNAGMEKQGPHRPSQPCVVTVNGFQVLLNSITCLPSYPIGRRYLPYSFLHQYTWMEVLYASSNQQMAHKTPVPLFVPWV